MVAVSKYVSYNIHMISSLVEKGILYTKGFCIKTTTMQLLSRIRAEIHAQDIQGKFPSGVFLLRVVWIIRGLVSSTATHRQCLPTSSQNHCGGPLFGVLGKSLCNGHIFTSCKIMSHFQRSSALKIVSMHKTRNLAEGNLRPDSN